MKQKLWPVIEESLKSRIERYLSFQDKRPNYIKRNLLNSLGSNAIAVVNSPDFEREEMLKRTIFGGNIMHVTREFKKKCQRIYGHNEVTNDGEIGYAQQAATEAPAANEDFFRTALSNTQLANPASQTAIAATDTWAEFDGTADAITGSAKVFDAAFPKRNDGDADNTGAGVDIVSFLTSYTTGDFNDGGVTIKNFALLDDTTPIDATLLLTHGQITAFNKTASDTLKFFVNHEMRRV